MKNEKELVETISKMKPVIIEAERLLEQIKKPEQPKFKRGDFVWEDIDNTGFIYREENKVGDVYHYVFVRVGGYITTGNSVACIQSEINDYKIANNEQVQYILDKLHEIGKDWDAEKMEIVDYIEKIEEGDIIYEVVKDKNIFEVIEYIATHSGKYGNFQFKTEELAKEACDKLNEVLKTLKHY